MSLTSSILNRVKLKVNKVTSTAALMPKEYYHLRFCTPHGMKPTMDHENFGELLQGDRIESSPYVLRFKKEMYCEQVCIVNLGRGERKGSQPNQMAAAIHQKYRNNWIVDNLGSAYAVAPDAGTQSFSHGFPIGFVLKDKIAYIYNHVSKPFERCFRISSHASKQASSVTHLFPWR